MHALAFIHKTWAYLQSIEEGAAPYFLSSHKLMNVESAGVAETSRNNGKTEERTPRTVFLWKKISLNAFKGDRIASWENFPFKMIEAFLRSLFSPSAKLLLGKQVLWVRTSSRVSWLQKQNNSSLSLQIKTCGFVSLNGKNGYLAKNFHSDMVMDHLVYQSIKS